ncbi:MAG: hypothetical protein ACSLE1_18525 [Sphingobium sp.]
MNSIAIGRSNRYGLGDRRQLVLRVDMAKGGARNLVKERAAIEAAEAELEERKKRLAEAETAEALAAIERIAKRNVKESLAVLEAARGMGFSEALGRLGSAPAGGSGSESERPAGDSVGS